VTETTSDIAVIIVAYRTPEDVARCLGCLVALDRKPGAIVICENGGEAAFEALEAVLIRHGHIDGPPAAAGQPPIGADLARSWRHEATAITLVRATTKGGYAAGVNLGLRCLASPWRYVWILNPDTRPEPGALSALIDHADAGSYGCVGSRLVLEESGRIEMYGGTWRPMVARGVSLGFGAGKDVAPDVAAIEARLEWVCGASLFASRDFVDQVGPMDERYFLYNEEVDWCMRRGALRLGYAHASIVHHGFGKATGSSLDSVRRSPLSVYLEERNRLLLTRKHAPSLYPLVLPATLALTALYVRKGAFRNFGYALLGWLAGALGCKGRPWLFRRLSRGGPGRHGLERSDRGAIATVAQRKRI
jgi:N-acetylglucosaminyl-diphospho-decaprenol L-rhamnosyltransferase